MPYKNARDKRARDAAYHAENATRRNRESTRRARLKTYGITEPEVEALWEQQARKCAICHDDLSLRGRETCIDHDHKTKVVRGILCSRCNMHLGHYEVWPEFAAFADAYLSGSHVV